MRILITGGAGFIGSHLVNHLVDERHRVVVLDNFSTGRSENLRKPSNEELITVVRGNILDYSLVEDCAKGTDAIVHLAGITSVPFSTKNPSLTREINVGGTLNLLDAAVKSGTRNFVFASSCAVYGEAQSIPTPEVHPNQPLSPYAWSKVDASKLCDEFRSKYGLNTTCLRLFNVYGNRQPAGSYAGVITQFKTKLMRSESPTIYGDGLQTRDFIHVGDVVRIIARIINTEDIHGHINVGTGERTTIRSLLDSISRLMKVEPPDPTFELPRPGDVRHSLADVTKLVRTTGYTPETSLESGLHSTLGNS